MSKSNFKDFSSQVVQWCICLHSTNELFLPQCQNSPNFLKYTGYSVLCLPDFVTHTDSACLADAR